MAAKHSVRVFGTARFILSFAVAILVLLVVWIAVRAVGPAEASKAPTLVLPTTTIPAPPPVVPSTPSVSETPSRTPSAARTPTRERTSTSPTPRRTTKAPVTRTTQPKPPQTAVEATLSVGASWDEGYVAAVRVVNEGEAPIKWRVTVSHADLRNFSLRGVWNANGDQQGDSIVFTGGTLAPGAQATFGYQTSKSGRGKARPSACNALGGSCSVR